MYMTHIPFSDLIEQELNDSVYHTLSKIIDEEPFDMETFFKFADYAQCKQIQFEVQEDNLFNLISALRTNEFAKILFIHRVGNIINGKKWQDLQMNAIKSVPTIQVHIQPLMIHNLVFDGWISGKINGLVVSRVIYKNADYDLKSDLYPYCDFATSLMNGDYFLIILMDTDMLAGMTQMKAHFGHNPRILIQNHLEFQQSMNVW